MEIRYYYKIEQVEDPFQSFNTLIFDDMTRCQL